MDQKPDTQQNTRDRNARMALGLCIGLALGISIGLSLGSIPIGIAIGAGVGVSLGMAFSGRERESSRPLTIAGVALLLVGIIVLALVMSLVLPHWWCDYPILNLIPGC
jgi:multidrug transporter EmrE-like cation transporter